MALLRLGVVHQPLEFLLFSGLRRRSRLRASADDLHDRADLQLDGAHRQALVEAAVDAGASRFDIMRIIILPLSKSGIALGSIFVVSIVMGDFFVVKVMSGGGSASVVGAFYEDVGVLQYPSAAASAVVLTSRYHGWVALILRTVDVRKELAR